MEAKTFQRKKPVVNRGKLKKTIKNVICRPDPVLWPKVPEDQTKKLYTTLIKYKVNLPNFEKPHWKTLKLIPKEQRPKPPKLEKVEGLLFGMTECTAALNSNVCSAVIIEALVNPKNIVYSLLETCFNVCVPVLCLEGLRKFCAINYGIATTCLGVKSGSLLDLSGTVLEVFKENDYLKFNRNEAISVDQKEISHEPIKSDIACDQEDTTDNDVFLYRNNRKSRVFTPGVTDTVIEATSKNSKTPYTIVQELEIDEELEKRPMSKLLRMSLKKIMNNPNRKKRKAEDLDK